MLGPPGAGQDHVCKEVCAPRVWLSLEVAVGIPLYDMIPAMRYWFVENSEGV